MSITEKQKKEYIVKYGETKIFQLDVFSALGEENNENKNRSNVWRFLSHYTLAIRLRTGQLLI